MTRGRSAPPRIRAAFSVWAWLALTPYVLTAFAGTELAGDARELALGLLAACLVHVALLAAFLVIGELERRTGAVPWLRWTIVGVALAGLAVGRPVLLTIVQRLLGADLVETPWPLRILGNATLLAAAVLLIHAVIETMARARESERSLRRVLAALDSADTRIASTRRAVGAEFQRELMTEVLDALGALLHRGLPPDGLAKELRWIARSVVRRAAQQARSASLADAIAETAPAPPDDETGGDAARPAEAAPPARTIEAAPALAVTATALVLFLPPAVGIHGPLLGLLELGLGTIVSHILAMTLQRLPLPATRGGAIAVLAVAYLVIGGIYVGLMIPPLDLVPITAYYFVYGSIGYAIVGTVISLIWTSLRRQREHERDVAAVLAASEHRRFEAQRALVADAALAGQLLDTDVQGDILATSYLLETARVGPDALDELADRVEATLRGRPTEPRDYVPLLRDRLQATLRAWSLALDIEDDVDEAALDWLARHPGSTAVAHDALTEGLTNAIRYGRGPVATVRLRRVDDGVEVVVRSPGRLGARIGDELELLDLEDRARRVELRQDGGHVELRVRLGAEC